MRRDDKLPLGLALLLVLAAALLFIRLGSNEIQPWDEGLYVVRADAALHFGEWFDQSAHAPGGLYSATHPPLGIWAMSLSEALFGRNEWAFRLPGALLAGISIGLLYAVIRRRASAEIAALVSISVGVSLTFVYLARHAQLDIYLYFFVLLALWLAGRGRERSWALSILLPGLAFGAALLSKFGFAMFLAPLFFVIDENRDRYRKPIVIVAIGCIVAAPWYVAMKVLHPDFGAHAVSVVADASYEATEHAWWYYANQLLIALPFVTAVAVMMDKKLIVSEAVREVLALSAVVVLLAVMATSIPSYTLLLLLPSAFLLSRALYRLEVASRLRQTIAALLIGAAWLWSLSEQVRLLLKEGSTFVFVLPIAEIVAGMTVALIVGSLLWRRTTKVVTVLAVLLAITVGQRLYQVSYFKEHSGAEQVARVLPMVKTAAIVIDNSPHEDLLPALTYYTGGQSGSGSLTRGKIDVLTWREMASRLSSYEAVCYEAGVDRLAAIGALGQSTRREMDSVLGGQFAHRYQLGRYLVFSRAPLVTP